MRAGLSVMRRFGIDLWVLVLAGCGPARAPLQAPVTTRVVSHEEVTAERDPATPEYWFTQLGSRRDFDVAHRRIYAFIEAARAEPGESAVAEVLQRVAPFANAAYVDHGQELSPQQRTHLMNLLRLCHDPRGRPAFGYALAEFAQGHRASQEDGDVAIAARAVGEQKLGSLSIHLVDAYRHVSRRSLQGRDIDKAVAEAMVAMAEPYWITALIEKLAEPLSRANKFTYTEDEQDQLYWQTTAIEVLERIGSPRALEPLLSVVLDSDKAPLHVAAGLALLPLSATPARAKALLHEPGHEWVGVGLLGDLGRAEDAPEVIAMAQRARRPEELFHVARALSDLPPSEPVEKAFEATFDAIPASALTPSPKRLMVASSASYFLTSELVPWLLDRAAHPKGRHDLGQHQLLETALDLATWSQLPRVEAAIGRWGGNYEQNRLNELRPLLEECKDNYDCYLNAVLEPANRADSSRAGDKAATMLGVLGKESDAPALVHVLEMLEKLEEGQDVTTLRALSSLRFWVVLDLDHLLPHGSPDISKALAEQLARRAALPNSRFAADTHLRRVVYRLRARELAD